MSYAVDLWDQFDIVAKRVSEGKDFSKEAQSWFNKRAAIEKDYAKKLLALAKSAEQDFGSVQMTWAVLKNDTEVLARAHQDFSDKISANVTSPIGAYLKENSKPRRKLQDHGSKLLKQLSAAHSKEQSTKEHFENLRKKQDQTKEEHERATFNNAQSKQVDKLSKKLKADTKRAASADTSYSDAVQKLAATQGRVYDDEMPRVLTDLQMLEEKRIEVMKSATLNFCQIQSDVATVITECTTRISTSANQISTANDVTNFISENKTGQSKPPKASYQPYDPATGKCVPQNTGGGGASSTTSATSAAPAPPPSSSSSSSSSLAASSHSAVGVAPSTPAPAVAAPAAPPVASRAPAVIPAIGRCKALYDYSAGDATELSFSAGDVINILQKDESGWWQGELNGVIGVFPSQEWVEEF